MPSPRPAHLLLHLVCWATIAAHCALVLLPSVPTTISQPPTPIPSLLHASPQPTCLPPSTPLLPPSPQNNLTSFPSDCLLALRAMLYNPNFRLSRRKYIWKRFPPGAPIPEGYAPLPYRLAPASCVVELDLVSGGGGQGEEEDEFSLVGLKGAALGLFAKCIRGHYTPDASGFVVVGPRRVVQLVLKPRDVGGADGGVLKM